MQGRNRPPFVKSLETEAHFTINELEEDLSAGFEVIYESRWTPCCRVVEDEFQHSTDHLPFGIRVHRRAGEHCFFFLVPTFFSCTIFFLVLFFANDSVICMTEYLLHGKNMSVELHEKPNPNQL